MSFAGIPRPEKRICSDVDAIPPLSDLDKKLLNKLLELLSADVINFYRDHDFNGAFSSEYWRPISSFTGSWCDVEHEFVDNELEERKKSLYEITSKLAGLIALNTVSVGNGMNSVKPSRAVFTEEDRLRFRAEAKEINEQCTPFVEECESFVRYARQRLAKS